MKTKDINILLKALKEGTISREDHRRLELAALDDPFLFDALEGYTLHSPTDDEHSDLMARIDKRINSDNKRRMIYWMPIVAALFIGVLGFVLIFDQGASDVQSNIPVLVENSDINSEGYNENVQEEFVTVSPSNSELDIDKLASEAKSSKENQRVQGEGKKSKRRVQNEVTDPEPLNDDGAFSTPSKTEIVNADIVSVMDSFEESPLAVASENIEDDEFKSYSQSVDSILATSSSFNANTEAVVAAPSSKKMKSSISESGTEVKMIKGVVLDSDGVPLIGANILYGRDGVITDFDGGFTIRQDSSNDLLEINYTGYENKIIDLNNENLNVPIIITLEEGRMLDEVVVTGKSQKVEDWTDFDKMFRNAAQQDLFMYGIKGEYNVDFTFRYSLLGNIKNVEIFTSSHPILNEKVKEWINASKDEIPSRKGKNIERRIRIWQ